jgi:uncharacterized tellurite resistance protein B-like protein
VGFFSYEPGGKYHVRITDEDFRAARAKIASDPEIVNGYPIPESLEGFSASDFPVGEILASFLGASYLAEVACGISEPDLFENIELTREDNLAYSKFVATYNSRLDRKDAMAQQRRVADNPGALAGVLVNEAGRGVVKGILRIATGKSEAIRLLEKHFLKYISGDSGEAREYFLAFATRFGGRDEAVIAVAKHIRGQMWMAEFARRNHNILPGSRRILTGTVSGNPSGSGTAAVSLGPIGEGAETPQPSTASVRAPLGVVAVLAEEKESSTPARSSEERDSGESVGDRDRVLGAFMLLVVAAMHADGHVSSEESAHLSAMCSLSPLFSGLMNERTERLIAEAQASLGAPNAAEQLSRAMATVPPALRDTAFAFACDMVLADGVLGPEEQTFLNTVAGELGIADHVGQALVMATMVRNRAFATD